MALRNHTRFAGEMAARLVEASSTGESLALPTRLVSPFNAIGELVHDNKTIRGAKSSAGLSIESHDTKKDGILAAPLAAKEVPAPGAGLTGLLSTPRKHSLYFTQIVGISNGLGGAS